MSDANSDLSHPSNSAGLSRSSRPVPVKCKACVKCRSKKVKCDGQQPQCGQCRALAEKCVYGNDGRRNPRTKQDSMLSVANKLQALESLLKGLDQKLLTNQGRPHLSLGLSPADRSDEGQTEPSGEDAEMATSNAALVVDQLMARSPRQNFGVDTDGGSLHSQLTPGDDQAHPPTIQQQPLRHPRGETTSPAVANFLVDDHGSISVHGPSSAYHYQDKSPCQAGGDDHAAGATQDIELTNSSSKVWGPHNYEDTRIRLVAHAALERQKESAALLLGKVDFDGLDLETAQHLLQIHWNRHHMLLPLTYRPLIMKDVMEDGPYANKLLWNAIFYASALHSTRPQVNGTTPGGGESLKDRFYNRFKQLLADALERSTVPTISALLLMGSSLVASGSTTTGWNYCGLAYRMIIDLGLHLDCNKTQASRPISSKTNITISFSDAEQEMRRRIFYSAYITDKFQSLYFGRTPALPMIGTEPPRVFLDTYEDLELWTPYSDPSPDADEPFRPYTPRPHQIVPTFYALLQLAEITNDIIADFYMPSAVQKMSPATATECLEHLRKRLDTWLENLPVCLLFRPFEDPTPPPHQLSLHTSFHTLRILVHRPFLAEGHLTSLNVKIDGVSFQNTCLVAARQICHLAKAYEQAFGLNHAPYLFSYALFSAATVVTRHESDRDVMIYLFRALTRIQHGANFGLLKPLVIIRDLMERVGVDPRTIKVATQNLNQQQQLGNEVGEAGSISAAAPIPAVAHLDNSFVHESVNGLDLTLLEDLGSWQAWDDDPMQWLLNSSARVEDSRVLYGLFGPGD